MTKTKKSAGVNLENIPIYFADQPAAFAIGPQICRITFGVQLENGSEYPHPIVTIALPTTSLIRLANELKKTFDDASFKKSAIQSLEKAAREISGDHIRVPKKQLPSKQKTLIEK
jgi:hypothetical protein